MSWSRHDRRCCAEGCETLLEKGQLFCRDHYFSLPKPLRDRLWSAWRAAMSVYRRPVTLVEQARHNAAYQQAFQACQEHLRTAPPTPAHAMKTTAFAADGKATTYVEGRML